MNGGVDKHGELVGVVVHQAAAAAGGGQRRFGVVDAADKAER
jgi:hypothetical protein